MRTLLFFKCAEKKENTSILFGTQADKNGSQEINSFVKILMP